MEGDPYSRVGAQGVTILSLAPLQRGNHLLILDTDTVEGGEGQRGSPVHNHLSDGGQDVIRDFGAGRLVKLGHEGLHPGGVQTTSHEHHALHVVRDLERVKGCQLAWISMAVAQVCSTTGLREKSPVWVRVVTMLAMVEV